MVERVLPFLRSPKQVLDAVYGCEWSVEHFNLSMPSIRCADSVKLVSNPQITLYVLDLQNIAVGVSLALFPGHSSYGIRHTMTG